MLCLRHDMRPRPRGKKSMTGEEVGAINWAASHATDLDLLCPSLLVLVFYCPFWSFQLRCAFLLFVAFCCFSLPVVALSVHCSWCQSASIGPEPKEINKIGNGKCSSLVFGACFHLPFVAFCCSSLLFLVFEIESVLSQKPKQANAFSCSFWRFVVCFGYL